MTLCHYFAHPINESSKSNYLIAFPTAYMDIKTHSSFSFTNIFIFQIPFQNLHLLYNVFTSFSHTLWKFSF
jgi:hypothetical protein